MQKLINLLSTQELRDLKLLQKQEQKQFQDLAFKNQLVKEQQEKRFEVERVTLMKNYDNDLSSMIDSQKKQVDKCEQQQHEELKVSSKRIRNEQEKELNQRLRRLYPAVNENETPLPRSWSPKDKFSYIGLSQNNLRVHYKGMTQRHTLSLALLLPDANAEAANISLARRLADQSQLPLWLKTK